MGLKSKLANFLLENEMKKLVDLKVEARLKESDWDI
jgi:hypothetical protein